MRLFSTILMCVGTAVIVGVLGRFPYISPIPPWFFASLISGALFFGIRFGKYEEDIILLPFAAVGALFFFGSGVTTGVGVLMLMFALIGFANAPRAMAQFPASAPCSSGLPRPWSASWRHGRFCACLHLSFPGPADRLLSSLACYFFTFICRPKRNRIIKEKK